MKNLRELQTLVYQHVVGPEAAKPGNGHEPCRGDVRRLIRSDQRLPAIQRINIYANAYFYRLLECLKEEYPATLAVIGSNGFAGLIHDYLVWRPPAEPSIFYAGSYLAEFLRHHSLAECWPFIAELARLERTTLEIFHAPDAPILTSQAMRAIPGQQWPAVELRSHPGVEFLRGEWRITEVLSAVERGDKWAEPARETNTVIVWRQGGSVHYRLLEDAETDALVLLQKGASFADICETIAIANSSSGDVALIGRLLTRWLADEIIARADPALPESAAAL
ncbi:MAG: putative DNA-binding domain-containing protein [Deltaproteobacteria bacterium]|nr:putative DNA-binding domain-containing protein [Deltaproteobacteria bacterium]